jgi:RNA polymerase sigma-70 factor (ECF subfamily)
VPQPEQVYENRIQANEVREALLGLEEKYREVLLLRFQSDLSYEEIAEALDIPVTTVETRLHRAKNMMREKLGKR